MMNPLVSIGLPVYNGEDYLSEAIEAILAQTYPHFELIISDNGSTDRTQEICRHYAGMDKRIQYHRHEENRGATWNYNVLVDLAKGQYFRWASHDDLCAPTHLEKCVEVLEQEPEVSLCFPQSYLIDEQGKTIEFYPNNYTIEAEEPYLRFREFFDASGLCNPVFGLIRLDALIHTSLIESYVDSDRTLLGQLAVLGQFREVPEPLFLRRIHAKTSVAVNPDRRNRLAWFDPGKRSRIQLPTWRRVAVYAKFMSSIPLSSRQRLHCYLELARLYIGNPKWMVLDFVGNFDISNPGSKVHQRLGVD